VAIVFILLTKKVRASENGNNHHSDWGGVSYDIHLLGIVSSHEESNTPAFDWMWTLTLFITAI